MRKILLTMVATAFTLVACTTEKIEPQDNSSISLSQTEIAAGPDANVYEVKVTSSADWKVSGYSEWVRPLNETGKSGESLKLEVDASNTKEVREATFKVFSGSAVSEIKIINEPAFIMSLVSENAVEFSSEESLLKIKLDTNIPEITSTFTDNGQEWIEYQGREEVFGNVMLSYKVHKNEKYVGRSTKLTLKGLDKTIDIDVIQNQLNAILTENTKLVHTGLAAGEIAFTIKANVDYTFELPDWLTIKSQEKGTIDAEGLTPTKYVLAFGESVSTRLTDINFVYDKRDILLQISFRQQNPNAIIAKIADLGLRKVLIEKGWVLGSEASDECEVLAPGMTETELFIKEGWYDQIKSVAGLGAFPNLTKLTIKNTHAKTIDLSDCKKLQTVDAPGNSPIETVNLGSSPVTSLNMEAEGGYWTVNYFESKTVTVIGDNLEDLNMRSFDCKYYQYYDACETIDVSACPKLKKFDAMRLFAQDGQYYITNLSKIYVSQAQLDAYNAGTLTIERVVKTAEHTEEAVLVVK